MPLAPRAKKVPRPAGARGSALAPRSLLECCGSGRVTLPVRSLFSTRRFGAHSKASVAYIDGTSHQVVTPSSGATKSGSAEMGSSRHFAALTGPRS
jgi:hypothetical protein